MLNRPLDISESGHPVVALNGELTCDRTEALHRDLSARLADGDLVVDLSGVEAVDSTGVQLMLRLRRQAAAAGRELVITADAEGIAAAFAFFNLGRFLCGEPR